MPLSTYPNQAPKSGGSAVAGMRRKDVDLPVNHNPRLEDPYPRPLPWRRRKQSPGTTRTNKYTMAHILLQPLLFPGSLGACPVVPADYYRYINIASPVQGS